LIKQLQIFLGPQLSRIFVAWFTITGLISLALNSIVNDYTWVRPAQSLIVIVFLLGTLALFASRLRPEERGRWLAILLPAIIALFLGLVIAPQYSAILIGGGAGWAVAGLLLTRSRMPIEYREAIKHLRKSEYDKAAKVMERVIQAEPNKANHYRFRAEIYRLAGRLKFALRDYQTMAQLDPQSAVAFNGLAEVHLQSGDYQAAQEAAHQANRLASEDWVTYYNLGMIEDRLKQAAEAIQHLNRALSLKVPDARHRLLIHFYLARAYIRVGKREDAETQLKALKRHGSGLEEWQTILKSDQAETLRQVIGKDIETALDLINGEIDLAYLAKT
jgi:tetratricopeptide (TPR) repeat protein